MILDFDADDEGAKQGAHIFYIACLQDFPSMITEILDDVKRHLGFCLVQATPNR
ncbi:MAG: hypothetical protein P8129_22695 [Anaerolineae bacterium]